MTLARERRGSVLVRMRSPGNYGELRHYHFVRAVSSLIRIRVCWDTWAAFSPDPWSVISLSRAGN